jgi:hypothetical protein
MRLNIAVWSSDSVRCYSETRKYTRLFKYDSITMPFFNSFIFEERYHLLQKFVHSVNNGTFDEYSETRRLLKIQPIFQYFRSKFRKIYILQRNITVDESLIGWKGST